VLEIFYPVMLHSSILFTNLVYNEIIIKTCQLFLYLILKDVINDRRKS